MPGTVAIAGAAGAGAADALPAILKTANAALTEDARRDKRRERNCIVNSLIE
jgi:hypothetical protein